MTASLVGPDDARIYWEGDRDQEGHRTFIIRQRVKTTDVADGPYEVMNCPGLPSIGSTWSPGNDSDAWAFCWPNRKVRRNPKVPEGDPSIHWIVESLFCTKPLKRCQDETIEDPLAEPDRISGSFVKFQREMYQDRFGQPIQTSAFEPIRGVMRDDNRPTVVIEQNVAALGLGAFAAMIDTVNDSTLWGLGARRIKLSNVSWERKLYGTCNFYYTRRLEFDVNYFTFDEVVADAGTLVINAVAAAGTGAIAANDIEVAKDAKGENMPKVWLDGNGRPAAPGAEAVITIEKYNESNFLLLGVPSIIG